MVATVAETVEVYEVLKPKLGDQETKFLLRFIEGRTVHLVRDEIAKGLVTRDDLTRELAPIRDDIARLDQRITSEIAGLNQGIDRLDQRIDGLDQRIDGLDQRINELDQKITTEVARLDQKITTEFSHLDQRITTEFSHLDQRITTEFSHLDQRITTEIARLERQMLVFQSQTRLYLLAIGVLIILTNPRVLDFLGRLLGLTPGP